MFLVLLWWFPSYRWLWYLLRTQTANLLWAQRCLGFPIVRCLARLTPRTKWQGDLGKTGGVRVSGKHLKTRSIYLHRQLNALLRLYLNVSAVSHTDHIPNWTHHAPNVSILVTVPFYAPNYPMGNLFLLLLVRDITCLQVDSYWF